MYIVKRIKCLQNMVTSLGSAVGRVSTPRSGGTVLVPGRRHTKLLNNGTSFAPLSAWIFGIGLVLVDPVSV